MRYIIDHDFHIHSQLSLCSNDPQQTPERILQYARDNGYKKIALTNHFWDSAIENRVPFYQTQDYAHLATALPLPTDDSIAFLFGCEADIDSELRIGLHESNYDKFDFINVSTTHFHMFVGESVSLEERAKLYVDRFRALLGSRLPFGKVGIAHATCSLIAHKEWEAHIKVIDLVPDRTFEELFTESQQKGLGIELNLPVFKYSESELARILRPYQIAKSCGCKFYFGSDAHHPGEFASAKPRFERIAEVLELEESDKFVL